MSYVATQACLYSYALKPYTYSYSVQVPLYYELAVADHRSPSSVY